MYFLPMYTFVFEKNSQINITSSGCFYYSLFFFSINQFDRYEFLNGFVTVTSKKLHHNIELCKYDVESSPDELNKTDTLKEYQNKWRVVQKKKNLCSKLNKHTVDNGWKFLMLFSRTGEIYIISHVNRISFGWVGGGGVGGWGVKFDSLNFIFLI